MSFSFDRIIIIAGEKMGHQVTPIEFIGFPVSERIRLVLQKNLAFYNKGEQVDGRSALNELRQYSAKH